MRKYIAPLHYLTQDLLGYNHVEQAKAVLNGGCKWLQYRNLSATSETRFAEAMIIAELCDDWGATFMVCQDVELCTSLPDCQGIHLEDEGVITLIETRNLLGDDKTIGISASNLADCVRYASTGADYISIGPYAHTDTKPNNLPLLGIAGIVSFLSQLKIQEPTFNTPIIIAGGITIQDVAELKQTGVFGLAIAAAINKATNPQRAFEQLYAAVY